ncbi:alkaline phosphatase family protein [Roseivirga misakiensis]|uniref:Nucleotide pyrophosphatase n=1 Tax=Roseivirga misakiensis TaxID=1563681 RepID=A0A1E5SYW0_9BACT|nr:alkaline phosphatase family protein [Roseivirga misakiensis]OEK04295.1 nucleotide pyrophosphatase [Roseivirga misakiensis]
MKKPLFILLAFSFIFQVAQAQEKKVMLILLDGIPADVIESVETPSLDAIATLGGYTRAYVGGKKGAYSQTPTISAPGYMNMITGVWANKHNVWGNGVKAPNYNYWNVFRIVKQANPKKKVAIFSTWLDNRTKLVGESLPATDGFKFDYSFDGFELDTIAFPHKTDRKFIYNIDEHVSKEAARYIKSEAPDLSWVYLEFPDDIGHKFGDGPEMTDAVKKADVQVGRIWQAIKYRESQHQEDWMIIITTDHGRTAKDGMGHGGQSARERTTWITTNQKNINPKFQNNPAIVDIMPSILAHMDIAPSEELRMEIDGVSLLNRVAISDLKATYSDGRLDLGWINYGAKELEILITDTNNFAKGGTDTYRSIGNVKSSLMSFSKKMSLPPGTYKIVLKSSANWINTWLVID